MTIPHRFIICSDDIILAVNAGYGDDSVNELVTEINSALLSGAPPP